MWMTNDENWCLGVPGGGGAMPLRIFEMKRGSRSFSCCIARRRRGAWGYLYYDWECTLCPTTKKRRSLSPGRAGGQDFEQVTIKSRR